MIKYDHERDIDKIKYLECQQKGCFYRSCYQLAAKELKNLTKIQSQQPHSLLLDDIDI